MKSGKLRHVITIQRFTSSVDAYGTPTMTWADLGTLRAEVVQQATTEFMRNVAVDETAIVFRCRAMAVTNAERVSFEGQPFNIKEVAMAESGRAMELRCVRAT